MLLSASWALKGETLIKDILVPNSDSGRAHDAACTDTVLVNMMEAAVGRMQGWVGVTGYWKRSYPSVPSGSCMKQKLD